MLESEYRRQLTKRLEKEFLGCLVIKNDPSYIQGIPDLLVLFEDRWVMLEVKMSEFSPVEPNQEYWIDQLNQMSFAAFIWPSNEDEVFNEIKKVF